MRDKDYYENAPLDWSKPTNAVPGVEDLMRMREAEMAAKAARPEPPILTLRGFGGKSSIEYVPRRVYTVPGVGEDFSRMLASRSREGQTDGAGKTREKTDEKEAEERKHSLIIALRAQALDLVEGARRAGRAARELCREYLMREHPRPESREEREQARQQARLRQQGRMDERKEEKGVSASPTL